MGFSSAQFHHGPALLLIQSDAILYQNDLPAFVAVPLGSRTGPK